MSNMHKIYKPLRANSTMEVGGAATLESTLAVTGATTLTGALGAQAGTFGTTLGVTGVATFTAESAHDAGATFGGDLDFEAETARNITVDVSTTADTAGTALTIAAGAGTVGDDDLAGGNLDLKAGGATGNGGSSVRIYGVDASQGAGSTARAADTLGIEVRGDELGFFATTPVVQAAHIADASGDAVSECNAILVVLENLGFVASS
jgi:hypothetical protein